MSSKEVRKSHGFSRSKVARRIFFLFVLCALLPLSVLAVLSFTHVTKQLHRQTLRRLHQECKASGLTIIERLFFLETDLEMVISSLKEGKTGAAMPLTEEVRKRLSARFESLFFSSQKNGEDVVLGTKCVWLVTTDQLRDDERRHITDGKSLVLSLPREEQFASVFMIRAVDPPQLDRGVLVGEIHPGYLWGGDGLAYPAVELFVLNETGNVLFSSLGEGLPRGELEEARQESPAFGRFTWAVENGQRYLAGYRTLFMLHDFFVEWILIRSLSEKDILEPLQDFKKIFPLVVVLSFLVVLLLSHNQIRRNLVPIELLREAAVRFGERDFRSRVNIQSGDEFQLLGSSFNEMAESLENHLNVMTTLNRIGTALSVEKDTERLLEIIFQGAKGITNADGGSLHTVNEKQQLELVAMEIDSLGDAANGSVDRLIPLYDEEWEPDMSMVAAYSVLKGVTINVPDIYGADGFDFSWQRDFDGKAGYRSRSFLSVPLKNHEDEIIGVLQLVNAQDRQSGSIVAFSDEDQRMVETLASQAAVAMTKNRLIEDFKRLFDSLTELIATAIDEKSQYTGDHCRRVPALAIMIAEAVRDTQQGPYRDVTFYEEELYEMKVAALLHDCGKVTTPVHIIDKSKRLETIFDRMELIETRFEVLKRDAQIAFLRERVLSLKGEDEEVLSRFEPDLEKQLQEIDDDREFLRSCNDGTEFVNEAMQDRVREIANRYRWVDAKGEQDTCLTEDEVRNLHVCSGTLTAEERERSEYHVVATMKMLEALPYPKALRNVPEIVGTHHERIDGNGYPRGLTGDEIPIQGRILAIADVFEALTAKDRPYKKAKTLMEALWYLGLMKQEGHIDPDLFDVFVNERVYMRFAEEFLDPDQIDEILLADIPGYAPRQQGELAPYSVPRRVPKGKAA